MNIDYFDIIINNKYILHKSENATSDLFPVLVWFYADGNLNIKRTHE